MDWGQIVLPGALVLFDLGRPPGGLTQLQRMYGNLIVRLLVDHLMARKSPFSGFPVRITCDEVQILTETLSDVAEWVLTTGRSKNIALVSCSQGTAIIHRHAPTLLPVLLANTTVRYVGRLAAQDGELLARSQAPGLGIDQSLSATRSAFIGAVTNLPDRVFLSLPAGGERLRFRSREVDLVAWRQAAARHADAIEQAKARLALPKDQGPRLNLGDVVVAGGKKKIARRTARRRSSRWG